MASEARHFSPGAHVKQGQHVTAAALNVLFSTCEAPIGSSLKRVAADVAAVVAESAIEIPAELLEAAAVARPAELLPAELETDGSNTEHKLHLVVHASDRVAGLTTQMKWRLREGAGSAIYHLGVTDDGQPVGVPLPQLAASLHTLQRMATGADAAIVRMIVRRGWHKPAATAAAAAAAASFAAGGSDSLLTSHTSAAPAAAAAVPAPIADDGLMRVHDDVREGWFTAEVQVAQLGLSCAAAAVAGAGAAGSSDGTPASGTTSAAFSAGTAPASVPELRLAVVGHGGAGKSTYISCVTSGCLDDGRGLARGKTARHPHEIFQGRTSSVGRHLIGFDAAGELVCAGSDKVIGVSLASQTRLVRAATAVSPAAAASAAAAGGALTPFAASASPAVVAAHSPSGTAHAQAAPRPGLSTPAPAPAPALIESIAGAPDMLATGIGADAIAAASTRLVTLLDLAGDERCARTMLSGLLGSLPDALQIMLDARALAPVAPSHIGAGAVARAGAAAVEAGSGAGAGSGITAAAAPAPAPCRLPAATQQHIALAVSLGLPFFFVVTHADCTPHAQLEAAVAALGGCTARLAASYSAAVALAAGSAEPGRLSRAASPLAPADSSAEGIASAAAAAAAIQLVGDDDGAAAAAARCSSGSGLAGNAGPSHSPSHSPLMLPPAPQLPAPLFVISSVSGRGFRPLLRFIAALRARRDWASAAAHGQPAFAIQEVLSVEGCTVVAGLVTGGCVRVGDVLWLGPLAAAVPAPSAADATVAILQARKLGPHAGTLPASSSAAEHLFVPVRVACVHVKRAPVSAAAAGQLCTLQLLTVDTRSVSAGAAGSGASGLRRASSGDGFNLDPVLLRRGQVLLARLSNDVGTATTSTAAGKAAAHPATASDSLSVGSELTVRVAAFYQPPSLLRIPPLLARAQRDVVVFAGAVRQAGRVVAVRRLGVASSAPAAALAPSIAASSGAAAAEPASSAVADAGAGVGSAAASAVTWPASRADEASGSNSSSAATLADGTPSTFSGSTATASSGSSGSGAALACSASGGHGCGAAVLQLTVRLLNNAEYLPPGTLAVVRDGQALAAGCVISCGPSTAASSSAAASATRAAASRRAAAPSRRRTPADASDAASSRVAADSTASQHAAAPASASEAAEEGSPHSHTAAPPAAAGTGADTSRAAAAAAAAGQAAPASAMLASAVDEPWRSTSAPAAANARRVHVSTAAATSATASPRGAPATTTAAGAAAAALSSGASPSLRGARQHTPTSPAGPLVASYRGAQSRRATGGEIRELVPLSPELIPRVDSVGRLVAAAALSGGSRSSPLASGGSSSAMRLPPPAAASVAAARTTSTGSSSSSQTGEAPYGAGRAQRGSGSQTQTQSGSVGSGGSSARKPKLRDRAPSEDSDSDDGGGLLAALAAAGGAGF